MNLNKIAKLAGCSLSTVSKAFHNSPEISEKTRNRIFEIAKENNCFTKYYSPVFKKRVFAIICQELSSSVYSDMVEALYKKITDNGDMAIVSCNKFISLALDELLDYYINFHKIDGLILLDTTGKLEEEILKKVPTVAIGSIGKETKPKCDCVDTDHDYGVYQAISYLKEMGHTKIGYIGEYLTTLRLKSFKEIMKKCELEINDEWLIISPERMGEAGYDGIDKLISKKSRPTAVFAAYDALAFGAINRLNEKGLRVPDDISIIGLNDISLAKYATPALTTVTIPINELTDAALNLLYRRIKYTEAPYQNVSIQSSLIIRNSVKNVINQ